MPIYEYKCSACEEEQEFNQKISDPALVTCPKCGKDALERLVSASSFALKGSGWYADGYGGGAKGEKKAEKKGVDVGGSSTSSASASSSSSGTTDTKKASSDS